MDVVRVGIVGCGLRGRRHLECLKTFADVRIEAVCDPSERNLALATEISGARNKFGSLSEFLQTDLDAAILAVPAHLNAPVAGEVLRRGLTTLLEKPPAMTLAEMRELRAAATETGARCMVGVNRRFHPMIADALAAVWARGPVAQIVAEFHKSMDRQIEARIIPPDALAKYPNAFLMESPIHAIDLVRHIAGSSVERVTAAARRCFHEYPDAHAALVEFASGALATLTFNYTGDDRLERYEIHGRNISVFIENSLTSGMWVEIVADGHKIRTTRMTDSGLAAQNRFFIDGVKAKDDFAPPSPGLEEAIETMVLAEAIAGGEPIRRLGART